MADLDRLELDHARGFDTSSTMPPVKLNTEASRLPRHAQAQGQQSAVGFPTQDAVRRKARSTEAVRGYAPAADTRITASSVRARKRTVNL